MWTRCQKLVWAQERLQLNQAWKVSIIIYTWLVKTSQTCFLPLNFILFSSCPLSFYLVSCHVWNIVWETSFYCALTSLLSFSQRRQLSAAFSTDSAKHVHCGRPAALSYPSSIVKKRCSSLSSIARLGIQYPRESVHMTEAGVPLHACEHKLTFLSMTDTYISFLIQSLELMCSQLELSGRRCQVCRWELTVRAAKKVVTQTGLPSRCKSAFLISDLVATQMSQGTPENRKPTADNVNQVLVVLA